MVNYKKRQLQRGLGKTTSSYLDERTRYSMYGKNLEGQSTEKEEAIEEVKKIPISKEPSVDMKAIQDEISKDEEELNSYKGKVLSVKDTIKMNEIQDRLSKAAFKLAAEELKLRDLADPEMRGELGILAFKKSDAYTSSLCYSLEDGKINLKYNPANKQFLSLSPKEVKLINFIANKTLKVSGEGLKVGTHRTTFRELCSDPYFADSYASNKNMKKMLDKLLADNVLSRFDSDKNGTYVSLNESVLGEGEFGVDVSTYAEFDVFETRSLDVFGKLGKANENGVIEIKNSDLEDYIEEHSLSRKNVHFGKGFKSLMERGIIADYLATKDGNYLIKEISNEETEA